MDEFQQRIVVTRYRALRTVRMLEVRFGRETYSKYAFRMSVHLSQNISGDSDGYEELSRWKSSMVESIIPRNSEIPAFSFSLVQRIRYFSLGTASIR